MNCDHMRLSLSVFLLCISASCATCIAAPSFDCAKARTPSEIAICQSPRLAELDNIAAAAYAFIKSTQGRIAADKIGAPYWRLIDQCQGDPRCIEQRKIEEIALLNAAGAPVSPPASAGQTPVSNQQTSLSSQQFILTGDSRWIVFASRQNLDDAIGLARRFGGYGVSTQDDPNAGPANVISTTNGWYAVAVGPINVQDADKLKKKLAESWLTPHDAFLSKGQTFVEAVWQTPPSPVLATASTSKYAFKDASRSAAGGGIEIEISPLEAHDVLIIRVAGHQVYEFPFDDHSETTSASAQIAKLDPSSPLPQLIASYFTGGAHCCTEMTVLTFTDNAWRQVKIGEFDGDGPQVEDLNGDGRLELVGKDDSFDYAFAPYADSYAPPTIFRLDGAGIKDVTHSPEFRRPIEQMLLANQDLATPDSWHDNGFLGGWVAHKALIGEGVQAWQQMLQNYNRDPNSGFEGFAMSVCAITPPNNQACPEAYNRHLDFPTALTMKLKDRGYEIPGLTDQGVAAAPPPPSASTIVDGPTAADVRNAGVSCGSIASTISIIRLPNDVVVAHIVCDPGAKAVYLRNEGHEWRLRDQSPGSMAGAAAEPPKSKPDQMQTMPAPTISPESVIIAKNDGGTLTVPVTINDALTLDFIVDSGASDVAIPADVILTLVRTGTIHQSDFIGTKTYQLADGSTVPSATLIIHTLKVGDREVHNVMASVASVNGSLLLGQSFFKAFNSWSIDNQRGAIILK
jgi:clan AA aspartic protease (TIGR02281 family)